jgi:hypothetical protein
MRISRYALGRTLTWLGILAWVPYIVLTIGGFAPSILPFLAVHLTGILGGMWIKRLDKGAGDANVGAGRPLRRRIGSILVLIGIAVWAPYFVFKNFTALQVTLAPFLTLHLGAVLTGLLLRLGLLDWVRVDNFRRRPADKPSPYFD